MDVVINNKKHNKPNVLMKPISSNTPVQRWNILIQITIFGFISTFANDFPKEYIKILREEIEPAILRLAEQGALPGLTRSELASADTAVSPDHIDPSDQPQNRRFIIKLAYNSSSKSIHLFYVFVKGSKESEWNLKSAWQIDSNGKRIVLK